MLVQYDTNSLLKFFLGKSGKAKEIPDSKIDYSDIPPLTRDDMKRARRAKPGRPPIGLVSRKMISIKIDPFILEKIKLEARKHGNGYQTFIHEILEDYVKKHAA